jgi:hypothetical protein
MLATAQLGHLEVLNTAPLMAAHIHGRHPKDLIVLHETVSPNVKGLADIVGVEDYLASKDYGIHGMTDADGNIAWAVGLGDAIFWQAGGVNERSIGIEQVSNVMLQAADNATRRKIWQEMAPLDMKRELEATARLIAQLHTTWGIPLLYSDGDHPGVTSHWSVSQHHPESEGHTDCWPVHLGGYYPAFEVIALAKEIASA